MRFSSLSKNKSSRSITTNHGNRNGCHGLFYCIRVHQLAVDCSTTKRITQAKGEQPPKFAPAISVCIRGELSMATNNTAKINSVGVLPTTSHIWQVEFTQPLRGRTSHLQRSIAMLFPNALHTYHFSKTLSFNLAFGP